MARTHHLLICYDISDDTERSAAEHCLLGYATRIQFSVFECRLSTTAYGKLCKDLEKCRPSTGHIALYRLQHGTKRLVFGDAPAHTSIDDQYAIVF